MASVYLQDSTLTSIGNAIRGKLGVQTTYLPSEMPAAITSIPSGGGGGSSLALPIVIRDDGYQFEGNRNNISSWIVLPDSFMTVGKQIKISYQYGYGGTSGMQYFICLCGIDKEALYNGTSTSVSIITDTIYAIQAAHSATSAVVTGEYTFTVTSAVISQATGLAIKLSMNPYSIANYGRRYGMLSVDSVEEVA